MDCVNLPALGLSCVQNSVLSLFFSDSFTAILVLHVFIRVIRVLMALFGYALMSLYPRIVLLAYSWESYDVNKF